MKTNRRKPFILATLALGLVLVMGLGANTFAKYITTADGDDSARVAKWGVTATVTPDGFADAYTDARTEYTNANAAVKAEAALTDVVAPGTNGSTTVAITGTPEVACEVVLTIEITDELLYSDDSRVLDWLVTGADEWEDVAIVWDPEDATSGTITFTKQYAPNETIDADLTLAWDWDFDNGNDAEDTAFGDDAAADNAAEVSVTYSVSITQLDTYTAA